MQILKQSTVATIYVGPVLDSAGAAVTTAVLGDFRLVKNGTAATLSGATVTHDANGYYTIALTTGNTDTVGRLTIGVGNTAMSMATHRYTVLLASVFDAIVTNATNTTGGLVTATATLTSVAGALSTLTAAGVRTELALELGRMDAAVSSRMATYTQPAGFLAATFPGTVASTTNITTVGAVSGSVGSVTGNVGGNVSGSVGSISGVTFPSNFGSLAITVGGAVTAGTVSDKTGYTLASNGLASVTAWTVNITGSLSGSVSSVTGAVGSVASGVTVTTNNDKSGYSLATAPLDASGTAAAVWGALLASYTTAGTFGARLVRSTNSNNSVAITGANHVAADIHELQPAVITAADFAAGAIDANALAADAAAEIAASVWSAATRTLTAFSFSITVDAASIRSAIGMATANLDTQLDAIPTAAEIDTQLTASHGAGSWAVGGTGSGAFTLTVTVNDGTSPLQNATVRMVEGVNAYVGQTNASGVVAFSLDAATYSVAITKDGYSFTPTTKVVSATGSQTYSMTQITPTIPAAAGLSTGTAVCYGTTGLPIAGVVVTIQQIDGKGVAGSAYDGDTFTLTSNAQGVISHNGFVRGAVYSIRRGIRGEVKSFIVPDAASFDLSEIVGRD